MAKREWATLAPRTQRAYARRAGGETEARRMHAAGEVTFLRGHRPNENRTRKPTTGENRYTAELRTHRSERAVLPQQILTSSGIVLAAIKDARERSKNAGAWSGSGRYLSGDLSAADYDRQFAGRVIAGYPLASAEDVLRLSMTGQLPRAESFVLYQPVGAP